MKKLVTLFTICFLAQVSWGQSATVAHLMPNGMREQPTVFVNPPKYSKPFRPLSQDAIGYIDTTADAFTDLGFPTRINLTDRTDTLSGYGVHFTSPYTGKRAYLDSVTIMF